MEVNILHPLPAVFPTNTGHMADTKGKKTTESTYNLNLTRGVKYTGENPTS